MVSTAQDVGMDAMPKYLQTAASILQGRLQEFITSAGTGGAAGSFKNPTGSLKRILDRASQILVVPGDSHPSSSRRVGATRVTVDGSQTVCSHSCAYHEELIDPSLWSTLPKKVKHDVVARLPLPKVVSLLALSSELKKDPSKDAKGNIEQSKFLERCEKVRPKLALITRDRDNKFWVRLLDIRSNEWYAFQIQGGEADADDITAASGDGGFVCFVSTLKKPKSKVFVVEVVNPLMTKFRRKLPQLLNMSIVKMVQIVFDAGSKYFRVLVVGDAEGGSGQLVAQVYDTSDRIPAWTNAVTLSLKKRKLLGCTFGYAYHWGNFRYSQKRDTPCLYDFAGKKLILLKDLFVEDEKERCPLFSSGAKSFAQLEDRVFILQRDKFGPNTSGYNRGSLAYYIVEYHIRTQPQMEWVKVKTHACKPFENPPKAKYDLSLFACKGFLVVFARLPEEDPYKNEVGWLFNLITCKWSDLPKLLGEKPYDVHDLVCGLHWNIMADSD